MIWYLYTLRTHAVPLWYSVHYVTLVSSFPASGIFCSSLIPIITQYPESCQVVPAKLSSLIQTNGDSCAPNRRQEKKRRKISTKINPFTTFRLLKRPALFSPIPCCSNITHVGKTELTGCICHKTVK